jgi:hypothetical protein
LSLTLAEISVQGIRVERRRAHALAGLHALLVGLTFIVVDASLLRRGAETVIRVAAVSVRTHALMRTRQIDAFGTVTADLMSHDALVYVCVQIGNRYRSGKQKRRFSSRVTETLP